MWWRYFAARIAACAHDAGIAEGGCPPGNRTKKPAELAFYRLAKATNNKNPAISSEIAGL